MATYHEWNEAIARWFTVGLARGSRVFLSTDEEVLEAIGRTLGIQGKAVDDFCATVRRQIVRGECVDIDFIRRTNGDGPPRGVAFLAACVLAGSRMQNDDDQKVSENNFFRRLREVLGLPAVEGRPPGLPAGDEEPLWLAWGEWLGLQRLESTARRGEGSLKYTSYPVSQTLLREAEKEKLVKQFGLLNLGKNLDAATVLGRLSASRLPSRVLDGLEDQRRASMIDAIHEVYESWQNGDRTGRAAATGKLYAGLYRTVDFLGDVSYHVYPRAPRYRQVTVDKASRGDETFSLGVHRQGYLQPFVEATAKDLAGGTTFGLEHGGSIVLPRRDYWTLVSDPEGLEADVYASWGQPDLGARFVVLVHKTRLDEFLKLKFDGLIGYDSQRPAFAETDEWLEFEGCVVLTESSTRDYGRFGHLAELRPNSKLSISLSGGIRSPRGGDWMERHGPDVAIVSFEETADVTLRNLDTGEALWKRTVDTGEVLDLDWEDAGRYRLTASVEGMETAREIRIVTWESLRLASDGNGLTKPIPGAVICGASLQSEGGVA